MGIQVLGYVVKRNNVDNIYSQRAYKLKVNTDTCIQFDTTLSVKTTWADIENRLWNLEATGLDSDGM